MGLLNYDAVPTAMKYSISECLTGRLVQLLLYAHQKLKKIPVNYDLGLICVALATISTGNVNVGTGEGTSTRL